MGDRVDAGWANGKVQVREERGGEGEGVGVERGVCA